MRPSNTAQLKKLVDCGKQFYERQWMWGSAGNLSVKLQDKPLEMAITATGTSKGFLRPSDFLILRHGKPVPRSPSGSLPSSETAVHWAVYRALPDCGAVFHVHPLYSTVMSCLVGHATEPRTLDVGWFEMMRGAGVGDEERAEITILPNWKEADRIAEDITRYIKARPRVIPAVLIYNHGLTGWGRTIEEARKHLEIIEYVCQYLYLKRVVQNAK